MREPDGEPRRSSDLLAPLVQAYLRRAHTPAGRLASLLGRRGGRSASVAAGLGRLTPEERVCLLLRERLGLPVDEVAAIAGLGREQADEALGSARERLRRWLSVERIGEVARDGDAGKTGA